VIQRICDRGCAIQSIERIGRPIAARVNAGCHVAGLIVDRGRQIAESILNLRRSIQPVKAIRCPGAQAIDLRRDIARLIVKRRG
jgi:hypothetical protein